MSTVILILVAFTLLYLTKVYYTRSATYKLSKFDSKNLIHAKCFKCSLVVATDKDNLRVPFYCSSCK